MSLKLSIIHNYKNNIQHNFERFFTQIQETNIEMISLNTTTKSLNKN